MPTHTRRTTRAAAGLAVGRAALRRPRIVLRRAVTPSRPRATPASGSKASSSATPEAPVKLTTNVKNRTAVPVDKEVRVAADGGTLQKVEVLSGKGAALAGGITEDKKTWIAKARLEPGTTYTAEGGDGEPHRHHAPYLHDVPDRRPDPGPADLRQRSRRSTARPSASACR